MEGYRNISYPRKQLKKAYYIGQDPARKKKKEIIWSPSNTRKSIKGISDTWIEEQLNRFWLE